MLEECSMSSDKTMNNLSNRFGKAEESIFELEDKAYEIFQSKKN